MLQRENEDLKTYTRIKKEKREKRKKRFPCVLYAD
jgi:hypothetical protein